MLRTPMIAAVTVALLGGTALAQPATNAPYRLNSSDSVRSAPDYDDDAPPPDAQRVQGQARAGNDQRDRDIFCRRDAAARTGYTSPGEAAHDEQVRGSVGGTLGGAALGAVIGGASGNAGAGAAIGAGAGLLAGTAIGADNARHAARDVAADYSDAYYACMHEDGGARTAYGYGDRGYDYAGYPPPPPPGYYGYPYGYGYGYPYYGPSLSFGFGFGGGYHGYRGGYGGGFHGGGHHR